MVVPFAINAFYVCHKGGKNRRDNMLTLSPKQPFEQTALRRGHRETELIFALWSKIEKKTQTK